MTRFERRLLVRFLRAAGVSFLVLSCLVVFLHLPQLAGGGGGAASEARLGKVVARILLGAEIAVWLAAPAGIFLALRSLSSLSILPSILAAPRGRGRVRRAILLAAGLTGVVALATGQLGMSLLGSVAREGPGELWWSGDVAAWRPANRAPAERPVILFRSDGLEVSRAQVAVAGGDLRVEQLTPLSGDPIEVLEFASPARTRSLTEIAPVHRWIRGEVDPVSLVTTANRLLAPMVLVLLMAGLTLLVRQTRPGRALPIFLPLLMLVSIGMLWCSILVWKDPASGLAAEAAWLLVLAGLVVALDRWFVRRGLRY